MCGANRRFFLYLLAALLFASAAGALQGGEQETRYLISEAELQIIEAYKMNSDAEKQSWLLQVQKLSAQAAGLRKDSEALNDQLLNQQKQNRMLQKSFNENDRETWTAISMNNGEIDGLKPEAAAYKGAARRRLYAAAALASAWIVFIAFKIRRFFKRS
jgi:hypothetical protein